MVVRSWESPSTQGSTTLGVFGRSSEMDDRLRGATADKWPTRAAEAQLFFEEGARACTVWVLHLGVGGRAILCAMASVRVDPKNVREFESEQAFYGWLGDHWEKETEVWIRIYKVKSGVPSITPVQAIDVALCWGWIDGLRKGLDDTSFLQRYTPRRDRSVWSQINVRNVERLTKAGKMQAPGFAHVEAAKADGRWGKAYSAAKSKAPEDLLAAIRAVPKAFATYEKLSAQNRFALTFRVLNMKTAAGREKKIAAFVDMLKNGQTIHPQGARGRSGS